MSALPWILVGGGAAALGVYLWTRPEHAADNSPLPGRWVWPLGIWRGRKPEISDGFASNRHSAKGEVIRHGGVDLMYRRIAADKCLPGTPNGSRGYIMPDHRAALAAADGVASFAQNTPRGWSVIVDHAPLKLSTYYTHLSQLLVLPKQAVLAGQPIGIIGSDPLDAEHLMHLHLEVWRGGPKNGVDPEPLMRAWDHVPDPGDLPAALVAAR
jgi:murein DD-endopeptidase MepM/ murein hydrolase activator NlpD